MIKLTEREKQIINELDHPLYTVDFVEYWINRDANVVLEPVVALQSMGAIGYYDAVHQRRKGRTA